MVKLQDLMLYDIANTVTAVNKFAAVPVTSFATKHSKLLWTGFKDLSQIKKFYITPRTAERITRLPTDDIFGSSLISLKENLTKGIVYFDNGLHFLYHIRGNGVYIMTSSAKKAKSFADPLFGMSQVMDGFLYYDFYSNARETYINSVHDALTNKEHLLWQERSVRPIFRKVIKEVESGISTTFDSLQKDYQVKFDKTKLCLQAFMFIHFAKIIETSRISDDSDTRPFAERIRHPKKMSTDVISVDTFYDETMKVINPFSVTGHFRNHACGKGRVERKLIYIDGFMKTGYTRVATKVKIENGSI